MKRRVSSLQLADSSPFIITFVTSAAPPVSLDLLTARTIQGFGLFWRREASECLWKVFVGCDSNLEHLINRFHAQ